MSHSQPAMPSSSPQPGDPRAVPAGPPSKHQLALMIWVAVFPTLTVLNLTVGPWLKDAHPVVRTFVLATIAVPIVIYGVMPRLHRIRGRLLARGTGGQPTGEAHRGSTAR